MMTTYLLFKLTLTTDSNQINSDNPKHREPMPKIGNMLPLHETKCKVNMAFSRKKISYHYLSVSVSRNKLTILTTDSNRKAFSGKKINTMLMCFQSVISTCLGKQNHTNQILTTNSNQIKPNKLKHRGPMPKLGNMVPLHET